MFIDENDNIKNDLKEIDIDSITPVEALTMLDELIKKYVV